MNTHNIELPPLPPLCIAPSVEPVDYPEVAQALMDYARAAIEADRQRRGEPVAWLYEDELPDNYPYDTMFPYSKVDGVRMFPVYAPQPAEPGSYVHTAPDDCETLHWRGQILSLNELATISAEPVKDEQGYCNLDLACEGGSSCDACRPSEPVKVPNTPTASLVLEDGKAPEFRLLNPPIQIHMKGRYGFFLYTHPPAPVKVPSDDLAHEIWAAAQTAPGEGIEDAVGRVAALLARYGNTQQEQP